MQLFHTYLILSHFKPSLKMKLKFIYTFFFAALSAVLFMSNSLGRAAGGGGNSTKTGCGGGGCHNGGTTYQGNVIIKIEKNGVAVTKYAPDESYDVSVVIEKTAGAEALYGFQLTAAKGNVDAGTFSDVAPAASVQISKLGQRTFVEHKIQMESNTATMKWKAPAKGTGTVSFLAAGNIVNGKNGVAGDKPLTTVQVDLAEGSVAAQELPTWVASMNVNPNPISDVAFVSIISTENKIAQFQIFNLNGKLIQQTEQQLVSGENNITLNAEEFAKGIYFITMKSGKDVITKKVVKL